MATLQDIKTKVKPLADLISKKVASKAPIKTGRLRKALRAANTANTMFDTQGMNTKSIDNGSFTLNINYAPDDAPYGKYWNDPTVSETVKHGKTKNVPEGINFVDKALQDQAVQKAIDDLIDIIGDNILAKLDDELSKMESEY